MGCPKHVVAIIGGAVAGSEAAKLLAEQGIGVVVFEQGERPYGKIEGGLPVWHDKMRAAEFGRIDEVYANNLVSFVPLTRIGRDISFEALKKEWGFSAVFLANGAWKDRPLEIEGVDDYIGKGFYYQNTFMSWFNRREEKDLNGEPCEIKEGAIVIGGGLASIDVCKVFMLCSIQAALQKRGISVEIAELERKGCDKILAENNLTFEELDVKPCTLFYRRSEQDMPLVAFKDSASEEEKEKTYKTRKVLLDRACKRYYFKVSDHSRPVDSIIEDGRLAGLRFIKTETKAGKLLDVPGSEFEVRAPVTVSSIGSIPEPIVGIPQEGELYVWKDWEKSQLSESIYGLGNVVTGKGNIAVSRKHSKDVLEDVLTHYVQSLRTLSEAEVEKLYTQVKERQAAVGYTGNFAQWIEAHPPVDRVHSGN
ncbi:MAG: hypothetical protein COX62_00790 [Deltaproteobacteria bacterium CG_4_10_14_0_2_um_filter_43_8]|nr:MAG: hypothetical protein COX62_00790 [Deltaproteobacteria bacterium CG_4_10_14_0_2_um_filter_43_8]